MTPSQTPPAADAQEARAAAPAPRRFRWGFASAAAAILLAMVVGNVVAVMLVGLAHDVREWGLAMPARNWVFCAFLVSAGWLAFLQRRAIWRFLLDMHAGVALIGWSLAAIVAGVLVPQMEGFEDPAARVTPETYEAQYQRFADAEAYFLYHLTHLYGIGVPDGELPPGIDERLEVFGDRYGREEQQNRRKQMAAAFESQAKQPAIEAFKERHEGFLRGFFRVATWLHLNRAYKSYWFATLLALLACSVAANLFRTPGQPWFSLRRSGFAVTHIGVLVMLVGGGWSKANEERGILQLFLNQPPKRDFWRYYDPQNVGRMPFWVRLERFARLDWKQLEVGFRDAALRTGLPHYTLWPGRVIELDWTDDGAGGRRPRVRLEVLGLWEHARVDEFDLSEATPAQADRALGPLAVLDEPDYASLLESVQRGLAPEAAPLARRSVYLVPGFEASQTYYGPMWRLGQDWEYRLRGVRPGDLPRGADGAPDRAALFPTDEAIATLLVRDLAAGDVEPQRLRVRLGDELTAAGGYRIAVREATADYRTNPRDGSELRDPRPLAQQTPRNPGLWVEITPPGGGEAERRLVLENVDPEGSSKQDEYPWSDLLITVEWERWSSPGPPRFVLAWGDGGGARLYDEGGGETAVAAGAPLPLPGAENPKRAVHLVQTLTNAFAEKVIEFLPRRVGEDGFDESFYSRDARGLELAITLDPDTPEERTETVRMATDGRSRSTFANHWVSPEQEFYVHFFENDRAFPFEWRSVLSIYEEDPDGRWHVFSGVSGELLQTLSAEQSAEFTRRHGAQPGQFGGELEDVDRDGVPDWVAPLRRVHVGPERAREIRVNDYFTFRGYRFFQTNANPEMPSYSGIGVVYDPGIPTVLLGMYTIIAGTVLAFIVRPIFERRRKRGTSA